MRKLKSRLIIFTTTISLIFTDIILCQIQSEKMATAIKNHHQECVDNDFIVIAHRGFSSLALDNSQEAIDLCNNYPCIDGIEIDVRLTQDNVIVLSHNDRITFQNEQQQLISENNYDNLKNIPLKNNIIKREILSLQHLFNPYIGTLALERKNIRNQERTKLVTLKEILKSYDHSKQLIIDIKYENNNDQFNEALFKLLYNYKNYNIILQSFDLESLKTCQKVLPEFQYQIITSNYEDIEKAKTMNIDRIGIKYTLVNYDKIDELIQSGYNISIWNINGYSKFQKITDELREYYDDVSYITDYPDCLCYWLQKKK